MAINKGGLPISHLMFADDIIIFFKIANQNTDKLSQNLQSFCEMSGQKINGTKSVMVVSPICDEAIKEDLSRKLKVNIAAKIGKYLGIPIDPGTTKREIGNQIIDWLQSRLQTWKGKLLSLAGKLTLIKSVMQAMPIYSTLIHRLSKDTCNRIDRIIRDFWWGNTTEVRKLHTITWDTIFQPKEIEGVGIRKTGQFNQALLAKQYWKITQNPQSLLVTSLKGKYFPKAQNLWGMERCLNTASQIWKGIWRTKETQLIGAKWQVGMGDGNKLRDPLWYRPQNETTLVEYGLDRGTIGDLMDTETGTWRAKLIASIYETRVAQEILNTPHSKFGALDKILWFQSQKGAYIVNEGYKLITKEQDGTTTYSMNGKGWKNLWKLKIPYKIYLFLWKLLHNGLPIRMELNRRQIIVSTKCVMCEQEEETLDHSFLKCPFTRALWFASP